jgi:DNA-binding FadR family transcriptional regulator
VEGRGDKTVIEHGAVVEAIESGDSEKARTGMKEHLSSAVRELKQAGLAKRAL